MSSTPNPDHLRAIIEAATKAGADTWTLTGAQMAGLRFQFAGQAPGVLNLVPPHDLVLLIRWPAGAATEPGITFHAPSEPTS